MVFMAMRPMPALMAGVERLVEFIALGEEGGVLDHDGIEEPALGGGHEVRGAPIVMAGEADHLGLAGAFELIGDALEIVALGPVEGLRRRTRAG